MRNLRTFADYALIGIIGFVPIAIILQIVFYVQSLLINFILLVHGRYENSFVTYTLFASALAILGYFGYLLHQEKAHLLAHLENMILRIPFIGTVYRVTQKLFKLFLTQEEAQVRAVVYVEYSKEGMWVPTYITNRIGDNLSYMCRLRQTQPRALP